MDPGAVAEADGGAGCGCRVAVRPGLAAWGAGADYPHRTAAHFGGLPRGVAAGRHQAGELRVRRPGAWASLGERAPGV